MNTAQMWHVTCCESGILITQIAINCEPTSNKTIEEAEVSQVRIAARTYPVRFTTRTNGPERLGTCRNTGRSTLRMKEPENGNDRHKHGSPRSPEQPFLPDSRARGPLHAHGSDWRCFVRAQLDVSQNGATERAAVLAPPENAPLSN